MPIITVDNLKTHLNVTGDQDDVVLTDYIDVAEDYVRRFTGLALAEDEEIPASLKHAIRMLAAHFYENREATLTGESAEAVLFGVNELLAPHRERSF